MIRVDLDILNDNQISKISGRIYEFTSERLNLTQDGEIHIDTAM